MPRNNRVTSARWLNAGRQGRAATHPPQAAPLVAPVPPIVPAPPESQPGIDAAQLWLALHLPALLLEAVAKMGDPPLAVIDTDRGVQRVVAMTAAARTQGIQRGLGVSAALALLADLVLRPRDLRREQQLLIQVATAALDFSPRVSLEPPDGVLLEIKGSLQLFGGLAALSHALQQRCAAEGATARIGVAPNPLAALAGARTARSFSVTSEAQLVARLAPLPLLALRWPDVTLDRLGSMGVRTLGELLRLPRAGFAKRFGRSQLVMLDRLVGKLPEPRQIFRPKERFRGRCEPSFEISDHGTILRYLQPLLAQLERFLRQRQCALTTLHCRFWHRRADAVPARFTPLRLALAAPEWSAERFAALLGAHLERLVLPAPVIRCELRSGELLPFALSSSSLWQLGEHGGAQGPEAPALIERLRARLGSAAVYGLCLVPEHRPEHAWSVREPATTLATTADAARAVTPPVDGYLRRPLWLLQQAQPLPDASRLQLLEGPERIESGWWDGRDIARDYYLARDRHGTELWVYRQRLAPHAWFLHGVFG